jgi:nuclear cap-binding protein subunit 2
MIQIGSYCGKYLIIMAELYSILKPENTYYDRKNYSSFEEYTAALNVSTTVYVGNLSFYTSQDSLRELFSLAGRVKEIIMGIDDEGHPCGFCFVV